MTTKTLALIILDGWGHREKGDDNAIALAHTPHWDQLWATTPHTLISGSGCDVGLPEQQMGNSEVGHLNIGSGRIIQQEFTRISAEIESGVFFTNPVLCAGIAKAVQKKSALHILGLLSPGGVHSHEDHILAMIELARKQDLQKIYLHAFLDGRDTPPRSALASLEKFAKIPGVKIASIIGRYYAMDRDNRWDRIEAAYNLLTTARSSYQAATASEALALAYQRGENDEFVKATHIDGTPAITDDDVVVFMNYRADRARQLTRAFTEQEFNEFVRASVPKLSAFICLTQYELNSPAHVAYPQQHYQKVLGECLAAAKLPQLRIAETEKYAHVTFFFNGGVEQAFPLEERKLIPSPKVATYDLKPEMSAIEMTDYLVAAIEQKKYAVIIGNFANADMVGHTGNLPATIKAIETIDHCLGRILNALQQHNGELIITADHGNAEQMSDHNTGQAHTAHTSDPVPFIYQGRPAEITHQHGALRDIAPTLLYLLGLPIPEEMTGHSLVKLSSREMK